jgi:hypothetical protein
MPLAVDSSALYAIIKGEPAAERWFDFIVDLGRHDRLTICDVAFAELAPFFDENATLCTRLETLGIEFEAIQADTAFLAGQIFADYRQAGGPRTNLVPDFLIGAHALNQADGLLADDRGYLRQYFRGLKLLRPSAA